MKKRFSGILPACSILLCAVAFSTAGAGTGGGDQGSLAAMAEDSPERGENILTVTLNAPEDEKHREYLGVEKNAAFKVSDIDADLVIVEIFSMYCPHCQREAPEINKLYGKMKSSGRAKDRAKIIGIGVGNSAFEVDLFRKSYNIEFPLFPDEEFAVHKKIGSVRTPTFIGVKNQGGKSKVVHFHVGGIGDAEEFLKSILDEAGL